MHANMYSFPAIGRKRVRVHSAIEREGCPTIPYLVMGVMCANSDIRKNKK